MSLLSPRGVSANITVDTADLEALVGEVQATPTSNTMLDRLKTLVTSLATLLTSTDKVIPAVSAFAIVPHDTNALTADTRAIYVGVSGDVVVDMVGTGTTITFKSVPVGILPIQAHRVKTASTATNMIGLY